MSKKSTLLFFLALAIILGAFGAHGLKKLVDAERIESFKTGVMYHLIMCAALMVVRFSEDFSTSKFSAFRLVFIGVCLFSGSIYLLVFNAIFNWPINAFIGPITPIGGLLMIAGWLKMGWLYFKQGE
jgi:uncharacterized membrane protein YgdD (TMEM256/DUF423 family)